MSALRNFIKLNVTVVVTEADPSGVNDSTAAIQAAINSMPARGGTVRIPAGTYRLTAELTVTNPRINIVGDGIDATILRQTNATANGINFDFPISFGLPTGGGVSDLTVEAGAGFATAAFYGTGSSGVGIRVRNASDNFRGKNFSVHNFARSVLLIHCWNTRWTDFRCLFHSVSGFEIDWDGTNIGASNAVARCKLSNNGFSGDNTASAGMRILCSGGEYFDFVDLTAQHRGVVVAPTGGRQVLYLFFDNVLSDSTTSHGWDIDGTAGRVWSIGMDACWAGFAGGTGLWVRGTDVDSVRWVGGRLRESGEHGARISDNAKNVSISEAEIASNSRNGASLFDGVLVETGAANWNISDNRIGRYASLVNNQDYGITIAATAADSGTIANNNLAGNLTNALRILHANVATRITENTPVGSIPAGLNASDAQAMVCNSVTTVAAGATVYLGPQGQYAGVSDAPFMAAKRGIVATVFARVFDPPGSGQSFTYTLFKNGIATGASFAINGTATQGQTVASVQLDGTDTYELRLVTSAGAAVTRHRCYIGVE